MREQDRVPADRGVSHKAPPEAVSKIVEGRHPDPFAILGMQGGGGRPLCVRAFLPWADQVAVIRDGDVVVQLERVHEHGFFEAALPESTQRFPYRLRVQSRNDSVDIEDPYRFPPVLGEMDVHYLAEGTHLRIYETLGAHPRVMEGVAGTSFAVWAPNATRVSLVGPFNDWDGRRHVMRKRVECGVFEIFMPGIGKGEIYKFEILGPHGELLPLKADPYAFRAEPPPATASVVHGVPERAWRDEAWMARRGKAQALDAPISIYECHLGSWRRNPEEGNRYLTYAELARTLVPYVKDLGFTHIELLPVSEYPFDGSWGYQPIGLFAPTSRHGTPEEFAAFVEACHEAGLGLLIDWVPGHFPTDQHGLGWFDGTALYEHADPRLGFHKDWNTLIYNYGRTEVQNFLLANGLYWIDKFHIDGLRVDAVASMLYLDYSREPGEWLPNRFGGNENLEAIAFLKRLNELAFGRYEGVTTVAEESTAWPGVSRPLYVGGLGFGYKWNMGWMHDTLNYMSQEPIHRKYRQNELTFGLLYAFSENFVLPLSHDEVVHGKGSLIGKMPGDEWQKFANLRAYYGFMWTHPGKKLLFMGGEFAQWREWDHDSSLDWHLLDFPRHSGLQALIRDLNMLYRELPALHEQDADPAGFEWIDASDTQQSVVSFLRKARDPGRFAVIVCNFTPVPRHDYRVGVPMAGFYRERINTDAEAYGGSGMGNAGGRHAEPMATHGRPWSLNLTLPPLATLILEMAMPG